MQKLWQKHQKFMKGNAGFSLVELIIVIAIMAALVAILAPQYLKYVERSRETADSSTIDELLKAVQVASADPNYTGTVPGTVTFTVTNGVFSISAPVAVAAGTVNNDFNKLVNSLVDLSSVKMKSTDGKEITALSVTIGDNGATWATTGDTQTFVNALADGVKT